jgi:hypothetical protein
MLTYFLLSFANGIDVTFSQWFSLTFSQILADVNAISSPATPISFIILLFLPTISVLRPHLDNSPFKVDLFITYASILATVIEVSCMALAPTREVLIAAMVEVNFGTGLYDALRSVVTGLLGLRMK